jgi:predicted esterase
LKTPVKSAGLASLGAAACLCAAAFSAYAQESFPRGEVVETVWSSSDSTQSYALYLPSDYEPRRRWPVLFLMDPRGVALRPLELFREAAEEYGYLVISSHNTTSDGPREPNDVAMQAMLSDAFAVLAVDPHRLYLAGFSGTAREAWEFAYRIPENIAGVIGFGAGLPGSWMDRALALSAGEVAFFGAAGTTDFNYEEVRELDSVLADTAIPHRIEFFSGGHQWAPEELCKKTIRWMELQAIRAGQRPADTVLVDRLYETWLEEAEGLEDSGYTYEAAEAYRQLTADFSGVRDVTEAKAGAERLERTSRVAEAAAALEQIGRDRKAFDDELMSLSAKLEWDKEVPVIGEFREGLEIERLQAEARGEDSLSAQGAQRRLENAFAQLSFYTPRNMLRRGWTDRAFASLAVAEVIKPGNPSICWRRAQALVQAGRLSDAIHELECLPEAGVTGTAFLEEDPYLEPIRGDPRYRSLLERMRAGDS